MAEHYDVIIVGTGAGGGTLAHTLAPSGKRILLVERGDFLPREKENWEPGPVFVEGRYTSSDSWQDKDGNAFQPGVHYYVGGATKLYGAALYRLRPGDFGELTHVKNFYMSMDIPVAGVAHQAGTCRFGDDPHTSVLDANCKAHELDNLYVVDTSFFPSIGAVNPALTAMANAIRVGEYLTERLA